MLQSLETALLDVLNEVQGTDIHLIIGGGYGLNLRIKNRQESGERTLYDVWPEERSTGDIDLFLRPELLIDSNRLKPLSEALSKLNYEVVPGAEKYQFAKSGSGDPEIEIIKIDILTGPEDCFRDTSVRIDDRRARPNPSVGIHAHPTNEALTLEEELFPMMIEGELSDGEPFKAIVYLPHAFTFLMMKLFAYKDRYEDEDKEYGRYHALDMYSILATTTETEWDQAIKLRNRHMHNPYVLEAGRIISEHFAAINHMGIIRLRESKYFRPEMNLEHFIRDLKELFPFEAKTP
ncbi:MAG: hypothetical protein KAW14_00265 [Candidatus Aegiribacteria sp.]|nr:hypothetical protein [Candidatus Aegiribacteria sp.]